MTENATETQTYTAEELDKMWAALPEPIQDAILTVNNQIDAHNANVAIIKASKESDTTRLLSEIREQNPQNDPELAKFNAEITKLNERIEALVDKANRAAEKYLPASITEEQVTKATEETKKSSIAIREAVKAVETFSTLMPNLQLSAHIKEMQSTRGLALIGSRGGSGETWRPRMTDIWLNGNPVKAKVKTAKGEQEKSTLNILAAELNKRTESKKYTTVGLQQEYLKAIEAKGGSKDNVPEEVEFTIPHTYTDGEGNEQTLDLNIKIVK